MLTREINPFVRFARKCEHGFTDKTFVAPDHRIFCCVSGSADVYTGGERRHLAEGSVIYWQSGVEYRVVCDKSAVITGCNFDFTQACCDITVPVAPVFAETACKSYETVCFDDSTLFNNPFVLHREYVLTDKFLELAEEYDGKQIYYAQKCSSILKGILIECLRSFEMGHNSKSAELAGQVLGYIRQNYNQNLTNSQIGEHFKYHPNYLNSLVIKHTGKSMHKYLLEYRVNSAISMMHSEAISVSEAAIRVGMPDIKHFSKVFKAISGVSPSSFKLQ